MNQQTITPLELIRVVTAGSIDDGKSTLIGRLLYDTDQIYEDQLEAVKKASSNEGDLDFSLFTDGLAAEREQGITIDVAYRHISSSKRRFIIADVPGHVQYTKNMITGAANADIALLLVDASKGLLPQTKRHLSLCNLLGIQHCAVAINKMDAVSYSAKQFEYIRNSISAFCSKIQMKNAYCIPISSLKGDMVVGRLGNMPWFKGKTILEYLEEVDISSQTHAQRVRLPVQYIIKLGSNNRYYAGMLEGGTLRIGDTISVWPSGQRSVVEKIYAGDAYVEKAEKNQSIILKLKEEIDISRGDMITDILETPHHSTTFEALLTWLSTDPLRLKSRYQLKHSTKDVFCKIETITDVLEIDSMEWKASTNLSQNDIGHAIISTTEPVIIDAFNDNKNTGSFIIIDEITKDTVAAGIIQSVHKNAILWQKRIKSQSLKGSVIWLTGLSGSGKTTIAELVKNKLHGLGYAVEILDGDVVRSELNQQLGYSQKDREENVRIAAFCAKKLMKYGVVVIAAFISPYRSLRQEVRKTLGDLFIEVHISTPLDVCEARDPKGLYKKARSGEIKHFTGIHDAYEAPIHPELAIDTVSCTPDHCADTIVQYLETSLYEHKYNHT